MDEFIQEAYQKENINIKEIRSGSRRRFGSDIRGYIVRRLVEDYGIPLAEVTRRVGVSTSAVSKMISTLINLTQYPPEVGRTYFSTKGWLIVGENIDV